MSNNAHVFNCKKPFNDAIVTALIEEFVATRLRGLFAIEHDPNGAWLLKTSDYETLYIWLNDFTYQESEKEDEEKYVTLWEGKCISFQHGHGTQFMWWVDFALEEFIATRLEGEMYDDGVGYMKGYPKGDKENFTDYLIKQACAIPNGHKRHGVTKTIYEASKIINALTEGGIGEQFIEKDKLRKWTTKKVRDGVEKMFDSFAKELGMKRRK